MLLNGWVRGGEDILKSNHKYLGRTGQCRPIRSFGKGRRRVSHHGTQDRDKFWSLRRNWPSLTFAFVRYAWRSNSCRTFHVGSSSNRCRREQQHGKDRVLVKCSAWLLVRYKRFIGKLNMTESTFTLYS